MSTPFSLQATGEVDERFLLIQLPEHPRGRLQRGELAVGIEDVELAVILTEGRAGVGAAGVVDGFGRALALSHDQSLKDAQQAVAIGSEVLQHIDGSARVSHDGNEICGRHLRPDELFGSSQSTQLIGRPHGRHVEVQG